MAGTSSPVKGSSKKKSRGSVRGHGASARCGASGTGALPGATLGAFEAAPVRLCEGAPVPKVEDEAMAHDAYLCRNYRSRHTRPWPARRERGPGNFVGSIGLMEITTDCPEDCRPEEHKDWNMC